MIHFLQRLAVIVTTALLTVTTSGANCEIIPERKIVDLIVNLNFDHAAKIIDSEINLRHSAEFYRTLSLWFQIQSRPDNKLLPRLAIKSAQQNLHASAARYASTSSADDLLSLGLGQFLLAVFYLDTGNWIKLWNLVTQGRQNLLQFTATSTSDGDAWLPLGLLEVSAASTAWQSSPLGKISGFAGNQSTGINMIKRSIQSSEILAPIAATVLLNHVRAARQQTCSWVKLAQQMSSQYPSNPVFPLALQRLLIGCGQATHAFRINRQSTGDLTRQQSIAQDSLLLKALSDMGKPQAIRQVSLLELDPIYKQLALGRAYDVISNRNSAIDHYKKFAQSSGIDQQFKRYSRKLITIGYSKPVPHPVAQTIALHIPCKQG